ncbi:MAG: ABC transporter ATP-binding protein [Thermoplasmata archaeon]|nr:ABC transporter ATP-binding protein [Thermoplasmata archaeon]
MIEISGLSYSAGEFNLRDISFNVRKGETLVILGPTGAGKTVLLEIIAGFRYPASGSIKIDGREINYLPPEKRKVGMVYQDYLLFPHLNVFDNIAYGLKSKGMKADKTNSAVDEIAKKLGIDHLLDRKVKKLSGGEQQRVALARALIIEPDLLLLDEPFSAVDPNTKEKLMRELSATLNGWNIPVLYVTHDQVEAADMADNIAVMNEGRMVQIDEPKNVFSMPKSEFVAGFIGTRNIFKGTAKRVDGVTEVEIAGVTIFSSIDMEGDVHVTIRPEDIIVSKQPLQSSARNSLRGKVVAISEKGPVINVTADFGIDIIASITKESFREMQITLEDEIVYTFKAPSVNLF